MIPYQIVRRLIKVHSITSHNEALFNNYKSYIAPHNRQQNANKSSPSFPWSSPLIFHYGLMMIGICEALCRLHERVFDAINVIVAFFPPVLQDSAHC
ncbi:hypothetical protein CDAR_168181 [Caerostris darwini]|uniref:Uncharacterized protein n=1 Tax=Caerostris darwini TaxID=1538125 RepID=A0AAV4T675_9ARAC|nr:hypothetical protein CDAR_168181 [Caerostris darwini]